MPRGNSRIAVAITGLALSLCFATAVCEVSNNLHARVVHRDETVSQQRALLNRAPLVFDGVPADLPEFRNRILFPAAMAGIIHMTNLNAREAFLALRWMTAVACFAMVWVFAMSS